MTTQTRVPTADGWVSWTKSGGTYNYANVDEYPATNDADYNYNSVMSDEDYFTFSPFSIPAGSLIQNVKVYIRGKCQYDQDDIGVLIGFNGTQLYGIQDSYGTSFEEKIFTWATNPRTGLPFTINCVNGIGSEYLEVFGYQVMGRDDGGLRYVSRIYIEVNYIENTTRALPLFNPG